MKTDKKRKAVSSSSRAGLIFPVGRTGRYLKNGRYSDRIGLSASVFLAGVCEYLASEILEMAGDICVEHKKQRITPRHIQLAVRNDVELNKMMAALAAPSNSLREFKVASGCCKPLRNAPPTKPGL